MNATEQTSVKYRITITAISERTVTKKGAHTVIDERPWTMGDVDADLKYYQNPDEFVKSSPTKKVYGYAPDVQEVEKVETQILQQNVDTLDIPAVIKAVNGL
jgi:hypothetical protein